MGQPDRNLSLPKKRPLHFEEMQRPLNFVCRLLRNYSPLSVVGAGWMTR